MFWLLHKEKHKWPAIISGAKSSNAEATTGKNNAHLNKTKMRIINQLDELWQAEEIHYSFNLKADSEYKPIVTINNGACGYIKNVQVLKGVNLNIFGSERVALTGANGSGKSILIRAIMSDKAIYKQGEWLLPNTCDIAYMDQHYSNLPSTQTVIDYIISLNSSLSYTEVRSFLNQFLFRKNEEVNSLIKTLSGGEKARLSLASIASQSPKLLVLDEVTNNIDLITRLHITKVLQEYTGAMIIISHDLMFLKEVGITNSYNTLHWAN